MRKRLLISSLCVLSLGATPLHAFLPEEMVQETNTDVFIITEPTTLQSYFGQLSGFPHTYELAVSEPMMLRVAIDVPDSADARTNVSGFVLRVKERGGVEGLGWFFAHDASWEKKFSFEEGNTYLTGPVFEREILPGTYRVEINSPDNIEKYKVTFGTERKQENMGYVERVQHIAATKTFFGKSELSVIEAPIVYGPLLFILALMILTLFFVRKRQASRMV